MGEYAKTDRNKLPSPTTAFCVFVLRWDQTVCRWHMGFNLVDDRPTDTNHNHMRSLRFEKPFFGAANIITLLLLISMLGRSMAAHNYFYRHALHKSQKVGPGTYTGQIATYSGSPPDSVVGRRKTITNSDKAIKSTAPIEHLGSDAILGSNVKPYGYESPTDTLVWRPLYCGFLCEQSKLTWK